MKTSQRNRTGASYPTGKTGAAVTVREAKATFSTLVRRAAQGEEITITWHGQAKARLAPLREPGAPLRVNRKWLDTMRVRAVGTPAEILVRDDRDARD